MADTTIDATASTQIWGNNGLWGPYWTTPLIGVLVEIDSEGDVVMFRTTDGGANWNETEITTATTVKLTAWFARETPGLTSSNLLHIVWIEETDGVIRYRTIDMSDGSLGTERTVATLAPGELANQASVLTHTVTRNGNILMFGRMNATTDTNFIYRSTDSGVNWSSNLSTTWQESSADHARVYPANTSDDADAALLYLDFSANELSVFMWDDSAGTLTETAIVATAVDDTLPSGDGEVDNHFDAAVRHSDGFIVVAIWNAFDLSTADLVMATVNPNSIASPGINTSLANVLTDTDNAGRCALAINQQNDDVYVAYCVGATDVTATDVRFKVSTDDLASFGSEQAYSEATAAHNRRIAGPRSISADGGRIQWSWYEIAADDVFVNLVNDVEISAQASLAESVFSHPAPTLDGAPAQVGNGDVKVRSLHFPAAEYATPFWVRPDAVDARTQRVDALPQTLVLKCGSIEVLSAAP